MERNWTPQRIPRLDGKLAIVTGASSGIGYSTALELARAGAHVLLGCRDANRGIAARNRLLIEVPTRELTEDGFERQFGTNHLGHFALTGQILPLLEQASAPRVVTVSSGLAARGRINFDNLQSEKMYSPQRTYEASKLANLLFMLELHRRAPLALTSVGGHPGVSSTELLKRGLQSWLLSLAPSPNYGAQPVQYAAVGRDVLGGDYFAPRNWIPLNAFGIGTPPTKEKPPARARDEALPASFGRIRRNSPAWHSMLNATQHRNGFANS